MHANGYFELSANRRDIWYGTDMMGAGKLRSDWNCALLEDVVAPSYVELLLCARTAVPSMAQYYQLWPQQRPAEPWGLLVDQLYASLLDQPVLRSESDDGAWVSPTEAVFAEPAEDGDEAAAAMRAALLRSGMPLVVVSKAVFEQLQRAALKFGMPLRTADAATVRRWLQANPQRQAGLSRAESTALLMHCLGDVGAPGGATAQDLRGLQLVPTHDGELGCISVIEPSALLNRRVTLTGLASKPELNGTGGVTTSFDQSLNRYTVALDDGSGNIKVLAERMIFDEGVESVGAPLLLSAESEIDLLKQRRPDLLVDVEPDEALGRALARVAATGQTNLKTFDAAALPSLLPLLLPASWRGLEVALMDGEAEESPVSLEWLIGLWAYLGREHAQASLSSLSGWPLLPAESGVAYALPVDGIRGSRMLEFNEGGSARSRALARCLNGAGCLRLHSRVSRAHPQLYEYVHRVSACAVLHAMRVSSCSRGGDVGGLFGSVTLEERRALRSVLAERRHVEERELGADASLLPTLRALPIWEVHVGVRGEGAEGEEEGEDRTGEEAPSAAAAEGGGGVRSGEGEEGGAAADGSGCVSLRVEEHRLAPSGVAVGLLDGRFVRCVVPNEEGLVRFGGVPQLTRSRFYREHVFLACLSCQPASATRRCWRCCTLCTH